MITKQVQTTVNVYKCERCAFESEHAHEVKDHELLHQQAECKHDDYHYYLDIDYDVRDGEGTAAITRQCKECNLKETRHVTYAPELLVRIFPLLDPPIKVSGIVDPMVSEGQAKFRTEYDALLRRIGL